MPPGNTVSRCLTIRISKYTYQLYKVISLEGDVVFPGGAITGGSERHNAPTFNLEKHRDELSQELIKAQEELQEAKIKANPTPPEIASVFLKLFFI